MKIYEETKRGFDKNDFKKSGTYVLNFLDQEYAYIKVDEIRSSFLVGSMAFSKTKEFTTASNFHLWYKDIIDIREATKMEDFFFLHHYNAVCFKDITLSSIKEFQKGEISSETALTLVDLKQSLVSF
jgi:hypothetical protein